MVQSINAQLGTKRARGGPAAVPHRRGASAGATSVAAANAVFSEQAAIAMVKIFAPNALTDKLEPAPASCVTALAAVPARGEIAVPNQ